MNSDLLMNTSYLAGSPNVQNICHKAYNIFWI